MPKTMVRMLMKKHNTNNPFEIAEEKGIVILYESLGSVMGYYNSYKRIHFIHINNSISEQLQRFVCAHELGHAVLHPGANTSFMKRNTFFSIDRIEVEANTFAVELLLPDESVYEYKDSKLSISELANICGVPEEVTHLKSLRNLREFF